MLEQHHAKSAWALLSSDDGFNWLRGLSKKELESFAKLVYKIILATDMAQHFNSVKDLNAKVSSVT